MSSKRFLLLFVATLFVVPMILAGMLAGQAKAEQVNLYAAGSLRAALGDVAKAFEAATGNSVATEFGPSGLLRQRIEQGEAAHVFASANMEHPQNLVGQGQKGPVALFTRNNLCALAQPGLTRGVLRGRPGAGLGEMLAQMADGTATRGTSSVAARRQGAARERGAVLVYSVDLLPEA